MIAHTTLHVSDYQKSKAFYIRALAPLGYVNNMEEGEAAGFFDGKNTDFWMVKDDVAPTHLAFEAGSRRPLRQSGQYCRHSRHGTCPWYCPPVE